MGKFLVTGCFGFIGAHVTRTLLGLGHDVVGVDNYDDGYSMTLKMHRSNWMHGYREFGGAQIPIQDVKAELSAEGAFDAVIHLAGRAGVRQSVANPTLYLRENLSGMESALELVRLGVAKRLVYASSSSVYSGPGAMAIAEMKDTGHRGIPMRVGEHDDSPRTPYAASKRMLEQMAAVYAACYGVTSVGLRYFSVYGPAGRPDSRASVFQYVRQIVEGLPVTIYGDPDQARDFTWIDDVVQMTINAATFDSERLTRPVYNVGSSCPTKVIDVITEIGALVGKTPEVRYEQHATDTFLTYAHMGSSYQDLLAVDGLKQIYWRNQNFVAERTKYLERCIDWYMTHRSWAMSIGPDLGDRSTV